MKARVLAAYWAYTNKGAPTLLWGLATLVTIGIGFVVVGISVLTDALLAGPELTTSAPSTDPSAPGIVHVTPTTLDSDLLRIAWGVLSALVIFGLAFILSAGASLLAGERDTPIFRSAAGDVARYRIGVGILLGTLGGLGRFLLEDSIASSAGIETTLVSEDHKLLDWLYAIPWQAGLLLLFAFAWIWERGAKLQEDLDQVV